MFPSRFTYNLTFHLFGLQPYIAPMFLAKLQNMAPLQGSADVVVAACVGDEKVMPEPNPIEPTNTPVHQHGYSLGALDIDKLDELLVRAREDPSV